MTDLRRGRREAVVLRAATEAAALFVVSCVFVFFGGGGVHGVEKGLEGRIRRWRNEKKRNGLIVFVQTRGTHRHTRRNCCCLPSQV